MVLVTVNSEKVLQTLSCYIITKWFKLCYTFALWVL